MRKVEPSLSRKPSTKSFTSAVHSTWRVSTGSVYASKELGQVCGSLGCILRRVPQGQRLPCEGSHQMIRTYFGLETDPFHTKNVALLPMQEEIMATLQVHCQQGGLCVLVSEPGTGKSVIKQALKELDSKMPLTPTVNRTLHMYHSVLRILCEAFNFEPEGLAHKCETALIAQAERINK